MRKPKNSDGKLFADRVFRLMYNSTHDSKKIL